MSSPENPPPVLDSDTRNWGMLAHLSAFVQFIGVPAFIGPLVVWLMKREQNSFVAYHGAEALNFNISFVIYGVVSALLILVAVGLLLLPIVFIAWLVLVINASVKASRGEYYRYPMTIRFLS